MELVELIQTDLIEPNRLHVHLDGRYSLSIVLTEEGVIVDVWEGGFEGDECLASCAVADNDWMMDDEELEGSDPDDGRGDFLYDRMKDDKLTKDL